MEQETAKKYGIFNNRGEMVAETASPENAAIIRDALNAHFEGLGVRYMVRGL